jgi:hypothetical protein
MVQIDYLIFIQVQTDRANASKQNSLSVKDDRFVFENKDFPRCSSISTMTNSYT